MVELTCVGIDALVCCNCRVFWSFIDDRKLTRNHLIRLTQSREWKRERGMIAKKENIITCEGMLDRKGTHRGRRDKQLTSRQCRHHTEPRYGTVTLTLALVTIVRLVTSILSLRVTACLRLTH